MEKVKLLGMTLTELKTLTKEMGLPSFTAKQMADWLYKKRVTTIEDMTNLSMANRSKLESACEVGIVSPERVQESEDGTKKYLFKTNDSYIETVFIPEADRATLCVSTQIGCKMNCLFCMTGKQGFSGNLTAADILNQMQAIPEYDRLTNVVFMGMGEPMDNVDAVLKSLEIMTSDYGYAWSPKRVTVSTVGLIPGLRRFLAESGCHLAVSLHNPIAEERRSIMPVQKAYPIESVLEEIKKYDFTHQRRVSFEYTMFKGVNDRPVHVKALVKLLAGLECRVNLIRFHAVPEVPLEGSPMEDMERFRDDLLRHGIVTTIRKSRGEDIFAACGLLSSKHADENR
ncbi:MAG: 23S rRNA (adenine(2503)-C(2))-methyltransferase RlmN [Paludibacteraceae bacterium]